MTHYDIYGIGAALVDTEIEVTDSDLQALGIDKGVMTLVDEARQQHLIGYLQDHLVTARRASGGSAANSIIAASYFGTRTFYSCKVADDDNGEFYRADLRAAGVACGQASPPAGTTGKCLVLITPDAERSMNTFLGISETVSCAELDADAIRRSRFAYIEGYLVTSTSGRAAAITLRDTARAAGVKIALSLSDPAIADFFRDGLQEMIGSGVDLLFCNEAEALTFTRSTSLAEAIVALQALAPMLAITRGSEGALIIDGAAQIAVAPFATTAVDSNGAGDMFAGAFLYGLASGFSAAAAGRLASRAAARVVAQFGPRLPPHQHQELLAQHHAAGDADPT